MADNQIELLIEILVRRDSLLLPAFYESLKATGQEHVVKLLKG